VLTFRVEEGAAHVVARYGWRREPAKVAGRILMTPAGDRIDRLLVTFEEGLASS